MSCKIPAYQFVAYIDEAGDPGLTKVQPLDPDGSSEWLCLGAVVVDKAREAEIVDWVRDFRRAHRLTQGSALHYRKLSAAKKLAACSHFAGKPLRGFVLLSNKKNMKGHRNTNAERVSTKQWFYNWCARLLLERVTDWCWHYSNRVYKEPRHVKIVFSESGGHSYSQTAAYTYLLKMQAQSGMTFLRKREIRHEVVDWRLIDNRPHEQVAGLQVADTFVSALYQAVDFLGKTPWDPEPAKLLKPRITLEKGRAADYGITLMPVPCSEAKLTDEQKQIFEFYGYQF